MVLTLNGIQSVRVERRNLSIPTGLPGVALTIQRLR